MPLQQWSDEIVVVDLGDEPQFSEDMHAVRDRLDADGPVDVVLKMEAVRHLSSSNIGALLRLRQRLVNAGRHLRLCCMPDSLWGLLMVMGLDKVFECSPDVSSALASLQLEA